MNDKYIDEVVERYEDYMHKHKVYDSNAIELSQSFLRQELLAYRTHLKEEMGRGDVKIGEKDNQGKDEAWCEWYKCPKCGDTMITHKQKYCGECGSNLKWSNSKKNATKSTNLFTRI